MPSAADSGKESIKVCDQESAEPEAKVEIKKTVAHSINPYIVDWDGENDPDNPLSAFSPRQPGSI